MPNPRLVSFFDKMQRDGLKLTYNDVRLGTQYSDTLPSDVNLRTRFTRNCWLNIPIVSSPMDTVTGADMAIAMAEHGGMGSIHRGAGMEPELQAKAVGRVVNRLNARIGMPRCVPYDWTVKQALDWLEQKKYRFHSVPVLREGKVIGLVSGNDFDFCVDLSRPITSIMTLRKDLITASPDITPRQAYDKLLACKKKVLPLFDQSGKLQGMYHFADLKRIHMEGSLPHALDENGHLLVSAAVGVGEMALRRAELLAARGCDVFHIDTAHGDSANVIWTIKALKKELPRVDVAAGNVSNGISARHLADEGADGVVVGQGPGSICTTRIVAGTGVPQVSAVLESVLTLWKYGHFDVPTCADGGIRYSGDISIALALGASTVMLGALLAGTEETPGESKIVGGVKVKDYRGMGSLGAMHASVSSRERYGQGKEAPHKAVPEGIEGVVPFKGNVAEVLHQLVGGIRSGMASNGAKTLPEFVEKAEMFRITNAGLEESHPHDVDITAQAPNYSR